MTVAELQAYVGAPARTGATYQCERGEHLVTAWEDPLGGGAGWWFAITRGECVVAMGWTSGTRRDRDIEIARAFTRTATEQLS